MGDGFKRVQAGQRLAIPARAYNAMLETAEAYQRNKTSGGDGTGQGGYSSSVYIKNSSGSDAARFDVLGISDVVFSPADSDALPQFKNKVVLTGVIPTSVDHAGGRFVICQEPIANGSIGSAFAHGVCQVQINVTDDTHKFADVKDSDHALLDSAASGAVSILWKESGTGTKWAVVRFGSSGGGGDSIVWVKVIEMPVYTIGGVTGRSYYTCRFVGDGTETYNPATTYAEFAECIGSDNLKYVSKSAGNIGHDPVSSPTYWEQSEEIKIQYALDYRNVANFDIRDCATWIEVGEIAEVVSRVVNENTEYYFRQNLNYAGTRELATLRYNPDAKIMQAVFK
ncbi:MAG: hypothetical protein UV78_C0006G0010 [Parcubacteria group bacterium GW2011_GWA2_43_17]|nr:MAG: hypothetical protein UV78_C0006G0010 [Parcubacteria group bacterium GW2011_GWA2_43_17]OHB42973.1 MAG: hypothetical protein A2Y13_12135 [Planctomycetes bacterium GWC2_45_44]HBR20282.1 hypothetical protein [Phycisphaerales bacterium]